MSIRGPGILFWALIGTVAHSSCATIDYFLPGLTFFGTVRNPAGTGVHATVQVQTRIDCASPDILGRDSSETGLDGTYELRQEQVQVDLDRCYVVHATSTDGALVSDTIRIPGRQLDQLGDPLGTGRIPLDIVVR